MRVQVTPSRHDPATHPLPLTAHILLGQNTSLVGLIRFRSNDFITMQFSNCSFSSICNHWRVEPSLETTLSRRERQVMDILFRLGQASAQEVMDEIPDPPSYSAIRALLSTLEQKQLIVMHSKDSRRYIYRPAIAEKKAKRSALSNLLHTFFEGKAEKLVASLLDPSDQKLSAEEIARIRQLIEKNDHPSA